MPDHSYIKIVRNSFCRRAILISSFQFVQRHDVLIIEGAFSRDRSIDRSIESERERETRKEGKQVGKMATDATFKSEQGMWNFRTKWRRECIKKSMGHASVLILKSFRSELWLTRSYPNSESEYLIKFLKHCYADAKLISQCLLMAVISSRFWMNLFKLFSSFVEAMYNALSCLDAKLLRLHFRFMGRPILELCKVRSNNPQKCFGEMFFWYIDSRRDVSSGDAEIETLPRNIQRCSR